MTEDSKAGFEFFKNFGKNKNVTCFTSSSNSSIFNWVKENKDKKALIIVDGAAFGSNIDRVLKLQKSGYKFQLFLPESFEWLILKSGIIKQKKIDDVLKNPSDNIESQMFFSWEQFFYYYLHTITMNSKYEYSKDNINSIYISNNNTLLITKELGL